MLADFVTQMLEGVDLERYSVIVPIICGFILILTIGVVFRSLITIFNTFFK